MDTFSPTIPGNSLAGAPPPPSEVKVRTMRSDLESMAKSGGGMPSFSNIKVSGLDVPKPPEEDSAHAKNKSNLLLIVLVVVVIAALAVAGWFAYVILFSGKQTVQANQTPQPQQPAQTVATPTTTAPTQPSSSQGSVPIFNLGTTTPSSTR
jgi:hypothetical protein